MSESEAALGEKKQLQNVENQLLRCFLSPSEGEGQRGKELRSSASSQG